MFALSRVKYKNHSWRKEYKSLISLSLGIFLYYFIHIILYKCAQLDGWIKADVQ